MCFDLYDSNGFRKKKFIEVPNSQSATTIP
jgi:hypothetical protein